MTNPSSPPDNQPGNQPDAPQDGPQGAPEVTTSEATEVIDSGQEGSESVVSAQPANDQLIADNEGDLDLGYQVQLDHFAGPLDLLLYLVRKAEVDIIDIPIAQITDEFLATLRAWEDLDLEVAGDFILMAATLLEIKAKWWRRHPKAMKKKSRKSPSTHALA